MQQLLLPPRLPAPPQRPGALPLRRKATSPISACVQFGLLEARAPRQRRTWGGMCYVLPAITLVCASTPLSPSLSYLHHTLELQHSRGRNKPLTQCFEQRFDGNFACCSVKPSTALPTQPPHSSLQITKLLSQRQLEAHAQPPATSCPIPCAGWKAAGA